MDEAVVKNTSVLTKDCIGCDRYKKDIMVSIVTVNNDYNDFFLTQDQAIDLMNQLRVGVVSNYRMETSSEKL